MTASAATRYEQIMERTLPRSIEARFPSRLPRHTWMRSHWRVLPRRLESPNAHRRGRTARRRGPPQLPNFDPVKSSACRHRSVVLDFDITHVDQGAHIIWIDRRELETLTLDVGSVQRR